VSKIRIWTKVGLVDQTRTIKDDEEATEQEKTRETEAQTINLLTKDIIVFCEGSWAFPYLIVVPINLIVSGWLLYDMYGLIMILCFVAMGFLLLLQYV
jgi:hypothetical protein